MKKYSAMSDELQAGKAAEHFVCTDLILKGYNAFLSDQGLPYDVVLDVNGTFYRIQVKGSLGSINYTCNKYSSGVACGIYRFGLRRGKVGNIRRITKMDADIVAFVALDILKVGYMRVEDLMNKKGVKTLLEFKTKEFEYEGRTYRNGTTRRAFGKFLEDYSDISKTLIT